MRKETRKKVARLEEVASYKNIDTNQLSLEKDSNNELIEKLGDGVANVMIVYDNKKGLKSAHLEIDDVFTILEEIDNRIYRKRGNKK